MPISTSEFILLGCLLALSDAALAETHPDYPAPECIVLPTPAPTSSSPSSPALPGSCYTTRDNTENGILPNALLPPAAHRPSLPPLHQSVERDRALRNGLLPDDEHGVRRGEQQRLPDVRPVPHPDGVDHVCHGVRGHADDYADYGCYADFLRKSRG
ncbi:hypothetical protein GGS24DRAFT_512656 [Hypoxylon argillaceum]|nr:hypothetical protein GGS24DRAFT_512656 [Hypoxylon argillaceum]